MTVREALNRGYNLVGTALVAISGFAFFPQTFSEDEFSHKLDEGGLFLLAIGALIWYFVGHNKVFSHHCPCSLRGGCPDREADGLLLPGGGRRRGRGR